MIQPWLGVCVLAALALAGGLAWFLRPRRGSGDDVVVATTERLRRLPSFQSRARREVRMRHWQAATMALTVVGCAVLVARTVAVSDESEEMRNRDVVLCMDVSGSMTPVVLDVMDTYASLVAELDGERIGFVMFDANAVTGFPLTDDYAQVLLRLEEIRTQVETSEVAGTRAPASGSSLIGDGLASCVQHFDRRDEKRSRTLVLASDNLLSGDSIYTLEQASDLAVDAGAMVYAVMPPSEDRAARVELATQAERTGGDVLVLDPEDETNVVVIADAVKKQEKKVILARAKSRSFDQLWPGGVLALLGLGAHWFVTRRFS